MADKSEEFRVALDGCYYALYDAYWAASSVDSKDRILGCIRHVSDMYDIMLISDLENRAAEFAAAAERIAAGNKRLEDLLEEIDSLINKIDAITNVISSIGKVLALKSVILGL